MKMGMIIDKVRDDDIAEFEIDECQSLEAYLRELCKRLGVEYGSEPFWDSYYWDTGGDYFEDVFSSKKGIFVVPFTTKVGERIYIFDNLHDLCNAIESMSNSNDVIQGGVYSFSTIKEATEYIKDLKQG